MSVFETEGGEYIDSDKLYPPGKLHPKRKGHKKVKHSKNFKRLPTDPVKRQRTLRSRRARHLGIMI